ncbi:hypothetical protein COO60DRAFT_713064 [Scenedesmus sp. NREL 46B-D3]|nr:hypothetical protein COO60DRAFT_713064 [Scenedesmus sp. NREL 46B-D3]
MLLSPHACSADTPPLVLPQAAALAKLRAQQAAFLQAADAMDTDGDSSGSGEEAGQAAAAADDRRGAAAGGQGGVTARNRAAEAAAAAAAAAAALHGPATEQQQPHLAQPYSAAAAAAAAVPGGVAQPVVLGRLAQLPGECVVCRGQGAPRGALAWLAHMQVCGTMARAVQEPTPWSEPLNPSPQQLLNPNVTSTSSSSSQGSVLPGFSWSEVGVQYGVYDALPGLHVTCCGHMMHTSCYAAHR